MECKRKKIKKKMIRNKKEKFKLRVGKCEKKNPFIGRDSKGETCKILSLMYKLQTDLRILK